MPAACALPLFEPALGIADRQKGGTDHMRKNATVLGTLSLICFWLVLSAGAAEAAIAQESREGSGNYPGNSANYRGVVVGKFIWTGVEPDRQIICDFGSLGVWIWDGGVWTQISGANPDRIIGAKRFLSGGESLIGDFGSMGIWEWDAEWGWFQMTGQNPSYMFVADDDGDGSADLQAALPGLGLWRMDGDSGEWTALSTLTPLGGIASDFWTAGYQEGVHSFGPMGVWLFFMGTSSVVQYPISSAPAWDDHAAANFGVGDGSASLIMDFGTLGIYLAEDESGYPLISWHKLTDSEPLRVREVGFAEGGNWDSELLCDFKSGALPGLWLWNYSGFPGTWTKLASSEPGLGFCEPYNADGMSLGGDADDEVAVDFEGLGLWSYDFTDDSWVQLSPFNPVFMVKLDLSGSGVANCLVVDFGPGLGLWCRDGDAETWFQLSAESPDESFDTD